MVLSMMFRKVVLTFKSMHEIIQTDVTYQCFPVVLFIMPWYKMVLTFECVDEIVKCDHSNERS